MFAVLAVPVLTSLGVQWAAEPKAPVKTSPFVALWEGTLKIGAVDLRLGFRFTQSDENKFTATMDSIDQGANDIPVEKITIAEDKITLELTKIKAAFTGTLSADRQTIKGEWKQSDLTFPLELKRLTKLSKLARPQTPQPPFPYVSEEVTFENAGAKIKLAGTLTKPKGNGPFPAVILITGSGPQDRDETIFQHKPFLVIADHLTRKGIAVLRFDDRGIGKSTGDFAKATSADFATDVRSAVAFLKERKDIDQKKIGLIGHSEGALVAGMVAAENREIAFIVLLAGPGIPGDELLVLQGQALLQAMKADEKTLAFQRKTQGKLIELIKAGADAKAIQAGFENLLKELPEEKKKELGTEIARQIQLTQRMSSSPWLRYFVSYDPRTDLKKVACPVLVLNGEKDLQVPPRENLAEIEKVFKAAGNTAVATHELKGLNHLFQSCKTGLPEEYGKIDETFSPTALDLMSGWILKQTK